MQQPPERSRFPFTAVVGADDMALALVLTAVSPEVGGVLVRGEKGTAKSTMVRGLTAVLPEQAVVAGCRFGCDPVETGDRYAAGLGCPDGPHERGAESVLRAARLVELPVGATEDRVVGSLDLGQALGRGVAAFEPGLLAAAHRGILYVDEVNLLSDHLVDVLLDAAAMGRNSVERDGVSVSHAARFVLVGTMNPEEGELRPQLLDRFGLTVEVKAPREPSARAEVVRRRMAFDADPVGFGERFAAEQELLRMRIDEARAHVASVRLDDAMLTRIAEVCAAFDVDGMRADIVTARAAVAHAAWSGRDRVTLADVRAAARLSLPHRRRRNPFDEPGIDEALLDELLGDEPEPDPDPDPDPQPPTDPQPEPGDRQPTDPSSGDDDAAPSPIDSALPDAHPPIEEATRDSAHGPDTADPAETDASASQTAASMEGGDGGPQSVSGGTDQAQRHTSGVGKPYRARLLVAKGHGRGEAGRRGRAITPAGRAIGSTTAPEGRVHLPATIRAAATRGATDGLRILPTDLRRAVTQGRESNLVLLCVDASGSMAARKRMGEVKTAVLSLLLDAYQRRDKVALVTFRGEGAELALPATGSVEIAARRLAELPHGGRTPLAEGLLVAHETLRLEGIRDPRRRPLLVVVTDGRATSGPDALRRAQAVARHLGHEGVDSVVVDCETGRFRLGLAARLAADLGAEYVPVGEVAASAIVDAVRTATTRTTTGTTTSSTTRREVA